MNTRFLESFVCLARLGSFSRTAEQLHASQPAISSRISALEDSLGVELYVRGTKPIELTAEGKQVLAYAEEICGLEHKLRRVGVRNAFHGTIKLGVIEVVTLTWLIPFIRRLRERYPDAVIEVVTGLQSELMTQLKNETLDMVLGLGPAVDARFESRSLCEYAMCWIGNPAYFQFESEVSIMDIARLPIVLTKSNSSFYPLIRNALISYGLDYVFSNNQKVKFDCVYSFATGSHLLKEGVGVMPMVPAAMDDDFSTGKLKVIGVREKMPDLHIMAMYRKNIDNDFVPVVAEIAREEACRFCAGRPREYAWA